MTLLRMADAIKIRAPNLADRIREIYELLHTQFDLDSYMSMYIVLSSKYGPANLPLVKEKEVEKETREKVNLLRPFPQKRR